MQGAWKLYATEKGSSRQIRQPQINEEGKPGGEKLFRTTQNDEVNGDIR